MALLLDGAPFRSGDVVSSLGDHALVARLRDTWGRDAEASVAFRIVEPAGEAPRLAILSPAAGKVLGAGPVDVSGSAGTSVSVDVDGVPAVVSNGGFAARGVPLVEGPNSLVASGRDAQGRGGTARATVFLDTAPPSIAILEGGLPLLEGRVFARAVVPVVSVVEANPAVTTSSLDGVPFLSGTPVTTEREHELVVFSEDRAGNRATESVRFRVDTTPPAVAITQPSPGSVVRSLPAALAGTCGPDAVRVSSAGRSTTPANGAFELTDFPFVEGRRTVAVTAFDAAGNAATATAAYVVDLASPALAITSPAEGAILGTGPVLVRGTATDATLESVTVDGFAATVSSGGDFSAGPFSRADGPGSFTASAVDAAGRTSTAKVNVTVDTVPPVVSVRVAATGAVLAPGALLSVAPVLDVVVADATTPDRTTTSVRVDGAAYAGGAIAGEGSHGIDVVATDGAGNVAAVSLSFTLDTSAPVFVDLLPAEGWVGRTATITVSGRVSADAASVTVNGLAAALAGGAFSRDGVALLEGPNVVALRAEDGAGNAGTATLRLGLDTTPPAIAFSGPAAGSLLGALTADARGTVADSNLESVSVDGVVADVDGGGFSRAGVPLVEGPNTLTATARDRAGNTASATVAITADSKPPVVSIGAPLAGAVLGTSPVVVTGGVTDAHLDSVSVDGVVAALRGAGLKQNDPRHAREWLTEWLEDGVLAEACEFIRQRFQTEFYQGSPGVPVPMRTGDIPAQAGEPDGRPRFAALGERIAVERGGDRRRRAGDVEQDRAARAAVDAAEVDAGDERQRLVDVPLERERDQDRHGHRHRQAGDRPDVDAREGPCRREEEQVRARPRHEEVGDGFGHRYFSSVPARVTARPSARRPAVLPRMRSGRSRR